MTHQSALLLPVVLWDFFKKNIQVDLTKQARTVHILSIFKLHLALSCCSAIIDMTRKMENLCKQQMPVPSVGVHRSEVRALKPNVCADVRFSLVRVLFAQWKVVFDEVIKMLALVLCRPRGFNGEWMSQVLSRTFRPSHPGLTQAVTAHVYMHVCVVTLW